MKRAIDNYAIGRQKEVNADEFHGQSISSYQRRFYCPECGEYVALVKRYGAEPFFRHTNRTESSPFCEERVDGTPGLTVYERVGLPVYIKKNSIGQFDLYIGFYALGEENIKNAQIIGLSITVRSNHVVKSREKSVKYTVDNTSFYTDQTTLKQIPFVPECGRNFIIDYSSSTVPKGIQQKWSDYADGFSSFGAIFTHGENGGRKIRRSDSITTDEKYLLITPKGYIPKYNGLSCEKIGKLALQNGTYVVHEIYFSSKNISEQDFLNFSNFCISNLGIALLYKQPEILPIWPPCTLTDKSYSLSTHCDEVVCGVNSGNDVPIVYEYYGNMVDAVKVYKTFTGKNYVFLNVGNTDKPISVDRKFSGNNVVINNKFPHIIGKDYELNIIDTKGTGFHPGVNNSLPIRGQALIKTNFKAEIIQKKKGHKYIKNKLKEDGTIMIKNISFGDEIVFCTSSHEIERLMFVYQNNKTSIKFDDDKLYLALFKAKTPYISVPKWTVNVLKKMNDYPKSKNLVKKFIMRNEIPIGAAQILKNFELKG